MDLIGWDGKAVCVSEQAPVSPARRGITAIVAALGALGILGAVGAYYVPGILDRLGAAATDRAPVEFDVITGRTSMANYVFGDSVRPDDFLDVSYDTSEDLDIWVRDHGGVLAEEETIRVVLWGRDATVTHIEDVRIKVIGRADPRSGWYNANEGCGAAVQPRKVEVDLDANPPKHSWIVKGETAEQPSFTVTESDQETFDITVQTLRYEVKWVVEVRYRSPERDGVLQIDNRGKPFVTTSVGRAIAYTEDRNSSTMVRYPEGDGPALGKDATRPVC